MARLASRIDICRLCPRLVRYLAESRAKWPDHRCLPVPGWGDPRARMLMVGLAPGVHGANKTGRMFTFDSSGQWVYGALHAVGLASRPISQGPGDGLKLRGVWITAAGRCAPPGNKPTPGELAECRSYLDEEIRHFADVRVYLALGRIAHEATLRCLGLRLRDFPFGHSAEHALTDGRILLDSYHPSRQNTNTGRLTKPMWRAVFRRAAALMGSKTP
ncbi:MAG TPA: uracil-DNA glycosylase [Planctomycetota bacterium]|nr:uracil-DNA glycosylase [Planctomycetota bacterium]